MELRLETLSEYVNRVMEEKNIKALDVEARSIEAGNKITDTYVTNIMRGTSSNLTIEKLLALAEGLGVDKVELFKVAAGIEEKDETWTLPSLIRAIQKLFNLRPGEIKAIKKILKIK
jgi:transcriptional regulator with XRE-family HTH domain